MHIINNPRNHYYCVHRVITIVFLLFCYVQGAFIFNILHKILEYFYNNYDCTDYTYVELSLPLIQSMLNSFEGGLSRLVLQIYYVYPG